MHKKIQNFCHLIKWGYFIQGATFIVFALPNVSGAMFIPEATFILDIRVPGGYEG